MQLQMEERALPMKRLLFLPGSQVWFQELRIHHYPEARLQGSEAPVRVQKVTNTAADLNVSSSMENKVNELDARSITLAENPTLMSDEDYDTLLRIVEAEAGSEDIKGRVLVANVIMNRVKSEDFPNTVTEVVWDNSDGVPQFSPTYDGRINEVAVSDETREAVKQALKGTDYSEGALFFIQKSAAEEHNVKWFEKDLKRLFKYGVHEFYTYK